MFYTLQEGTIESDYLNGKCMSALLVSERFLVKTTGVSLFLKIFIQSLDRLDNDMGRVIFLTRSQHYTLC